MSARATQILHARVQADLAAGRPERAFDLCVSAFANDPAQQVRHYAARLMDSVAGKVPASARTHARREAARKVFDPWSQPAPVLGAVAFPTVRGENGGCTDDCFVTAHVDVVPGSGLALPEGLDDKAHEAATNALMAGRAHVGRDCGLRLRIEGPSGWGGASLGLAVALATVSALTSKAIPDTFVATGRVTPSGAVESVGNLPAKAALLRAARPRARMLVAPDNQGQDARRLPTPDLEAACVHVWKDGSGEDLDEVLGQAKRAFHNGNWLQAARLAQALLQEDELEDSERVELLGMRLAAANHSGDAILGAEIAAELEALLAKGLRTAESVQALGSLAVRAIDSLDAGAAEGLAERAVALLPTEGEHMVHALGPLALVRRLQGRFDEAVALRRRSLALAHLTERPRCLGDLSAELLRVGNVEEALEKAQAGIEALDQMRRRAGYGDTTRPFARHHLANALRANGRVEEARAIYQEVATTPGLAPALFAQLADCALDAEQGRTRLEAQHERLGKTVNATIVKALFASARWQLGDAEAGAQLCALLEMPPETMAEAGRRLPY